MTDLSRDLGVQSYCFRGFKSNDEVIREMRKCGVDKIEICGIHADFSNPDKFEQQVKPYSDAGIGILSLGVVGLANKPETEESIFACAKRAGAKFLSISFAIDSMPDCLRSAEKLSEKYDLRLGIHNHGGRDWLGCATTLKHVFGKTNERIGLCLDTAWAIDSGENPIGMVELFAERLYGLHIKDFTYNSARQGKDVVVGAGNLKLKELLETLGKLNFSGYAVLEYEGDVNNPAPAVAECVKAVRRALGK